MDGRKVGKVLRKYVSWMEERHLRPGRLARYFPRVEEIQPGEWLGCLQAEIVGIPPEKTFRYYLVPEQFFPRKCDAERYVLEVFSGGMSPEEIVLEMESEGRFRK